METLIYGIGNPGRQDDGLSYEFIKKIPPHLPVHKAHHYQLNIEDSLTLHQYKRILFVDASLRSKEAFSLTEITPKNESSFTTHSLSIEALLSLTEEIFGIFPKCHLLAISGYQFEIGEGLSQKAEENLRQAHTYIDKYFFKKYI